MRLPFAPVGRKLWVYDIEVFPNHFLATFYNGDTWRVYDETMIVDMVSDLDTKTLVLAGYNNFDYDDIIIKVLCMHPNMTTRNIYDMSKTLITDKSDTVKDRIFKVKYADPTWNYSIDVFQLLNGKTSLKEQECRIGFPVVIESPHDFDKDLPAEAREEVQQYCRNDVEATAALLIKHWDRVVLRSELDKQYQLGKRVYCLSEQGVAQTTFLTLHRRRTNENTQTCREAAAANPDNLKTEWSLSDIINQKVSYTDPVLQDLLFRMRLGSVVGNEDRSKWGIHISDESTVTFDNVQYQIGVGGLHSVDGPLIISGNDEWAIVDMDVASYYPSIIINDKLYPKHIGPEFTSDMMMLRDRRLTAKRSGDKKTADALKIVINATFGKLNDKYSPLRSVPDAMRVTINGQLYLLMLIERAVNLGAKILSANTDGVTVYVRRCDIDALKSTASEWEKRLGFELEYQEYSNIFRRDVNDYMAISTSGKIKYKGAINAESGKGDGVIVKKAAERFLIDGIPPDVTICEEKNILPFLYYQRTNRGTGLTFADQPLGKSVRWYASTDGKPIKRINRETAKRKANTTTLPNGDRCNLAMDIRNMSTIPNNIDYEHYEKAAWAIIDKFSNSGTEPV